MKVSLKTKQKQHFLHDSLSNFCNIKRFCDVPVLQNKHGFVIRREIVACSYTSNAKMTLDIMPNLISHGRHIYNELCPPSRRPVHLFERNIFHAVAFQEKQNKLRTVRYINDVLSLNNSMLGYYVHRINSIAFEAKDTTYTASYFDRLRIKLYAKEFVMYMQEHSSSTCIWNISLSVDEVCQYLSFLSELLLRMSPIQGIKGYVQVITRTTDILCLPLTQCSPPILFYDMSRNI